MQEWRRAKTNANGNETVKQTGDAGGGVDTITNAGGGIDSVINKGDVASRDSTQESVITEKDGISKNCKEDVISRTSTQVEHVISDPLLLSIWTHLQSVPLSGIVCALVCVLFWSGMGLSFKLNKDLHALQTLTYSSLMVTVIYLFIVLKCYTIQSDTKHEPKWKMLLGIPGERIYLAARCFLGTLSLASFYSSYRYISMGDATTLRFTSPVFIAIFAKFMVNEAFGLLQGFNSLLTVFGVVLISRPKLIFQFIDPATNSSSHNHTETLESAQNVIDYLPIVARSLEDRFTDALATTAKPDHYIQFGGTWLGLTLALFAAITISISMISMKKLIRTPAPVMIFWFALSNVLFGAISSCVLQLYKMPDWRAFGFICSAAVCSVFDLLFITLALKLENAGVVAVVQALCVVLSFVFSIVILDEPFYWTSVIGGGVISLSVIITGISKTDYWQRLQDRMQSSSNQSFDINGNYSKFSNTSLKSSQNIDSSLAELGLPRTKPGPCLIRFGPLSPVTEPQHAHNRKNSSYLSHLLASSQLGLVPPKKVAFQ